MKIVKCRDPGFQCDFMAVGTELEDVKIQCLTILKTNIKMNLKRCLMRILVISGTGYQLFWEEAAAAVFYKEQG